MPIPALIAPLLASGLNLIANAALTKGKEYVEEKTGVRLDGSTLNESDYLKLKQYELENERDLRALQVEDNRIDAEIRKAELSGVDSARKMQIAALQQEDKFAKRFVYWYAIAWTVFAFIYISCVTFIDIPTANQRIVDTILGFLLGTALGGILAFFFGSSSGSKKKDEMVPEILATIKQLAKQ